MDEPRPAETGSWFALWIPSIPRACGGRSAISACYWQAAVLMRKSMCAWVHAQSPTAPSWLACPCLSVTSTTQRAPAASRATKHPAPPTNCTLNLTVAFRPCNSVTTWMVFIKTTRSFVFISLCLSSSKIHGNRYTGWDWKNYLGSDAVIILGWKYMFIRTPANFFQIKTYHIKKAVITSKNKLELTRCCLVMFFKENRNTNQK